MLQRTMPHEKGQILRLKAEENPNLLSRGQQSLGTMPVGFAFEKGDRDGGLSASSHRQCRRL